MCVCAHARTRACMHACNCVCYLLGVVSAMDVFLLSVDANCGNFDNLGSNMNYSYLRRHDRWKMEMIV